MAKVSAEIWRHRISIATKKLDEQKIIWRRLRGYYQNVFETFEADVDSITVNSAYSYLKTSLPALYTKNPFIVIKPRREKDKEGAETIEKVVNYYWDELKNKRVAKETIVDTLLYGLGISETGYTYEEEEKEILKSGEMNIYIKKESVFTRRVSPFNMLFDSEATHPDESRWMIKILLRRLEEVKANSRYNKNKANVNAKRHVKAAEELISSDSSAKEEFDRVMLYEIYDRQNQTKQVLAEGTDDFLYDEEWEEEIEGFPFEILMFNKIPDVFYPVPDLIYIEKQMLERNRMRTYQIEHMKRFNRKYEAVPKKMHEDQVEKLTEGKDGTIILVKEVGHIKAIPDAPLAPEIYNSEAAVINDEDEILGLLEYKRTGMSAGAGTATEAMMMEATKKLRIDDRTDDISDYLINIIRKQIQTMRQHYDRERVIRITGNKEDEWLKFSKEKLQAEVDIKVELKATRQLHQELKRKQFLDLLNFLGSPIINQLLAIQGKKINLSELITVILKTYDIEYIGKIIEDISEDEGLPFPEGVPQGGEGGGGGGGSPALFPGKLTEKPTTGIDLVREMVSGTMGSLSGNIPTKIADRKAGK